MTRQSAHPYKALEDRHFWSSAVAKRNMFDIAELWDPRFRIGRNMKVATFGSCFAQHIGKALQARGFNWFIAEQAPAGTSPEIARKFNYGLFSARTGNIYTVSLLRQWVEWATGETPVPDECWEQDGRFYDPFRPQIEPDGFETCDELLQSRNAALAAFRTTLTDSNVFVFTLGLTESWVNEPAGHEYPMCPGTVAGSFDEATHRFINQDFDFIRDTLFETIAKIRAINPEIQFLLTVSPVPLTATMSGNHVLVATMESKSILRAVAAAARNRFAYVDYFPSYEIINATPFRGAFFEANQRNVNHVGVDHVMNSFFACLQQKFKMGPAKAAGARRAGAARRKRPISEDDARCEEELLEAFAGSRSEG